jgi:hypothetical protein
MNFRTKVLLAPVFDEPFYESTRGGGTVFSTPNPVL